MQICRWTHYPLSTQKGHNIQGDYCFPIVNLHLYTCDIIQAGLAGWTRLSVSNKQVFSSKPGWHILIWHDMTWDFFQYDERPIDTVMWPLGLHSNQIPKTQDFDLQLLKADSTFVICANSVVNVHPSIWWSEFFFTNKTSQNILEQVETEPFLCHISKCHKMASHYVWEWLEFKKTPPTLLKNVMLWWNKTPRMLCHGGIKPQFKSQRRTMHHCTVPIK
jgi:hypothetical protein